MEKLGEILYINDWDYKVRLVRLRETGSKRISIQIYVEAPDGSMSDIVTVKLSDLNSKPKALDFLYDMEGGFTNDDITHIKDKIKVDRSKVLDIEEKAPVERIHTQISRYIRENGEELTDNIQADIFIRNGYGYIQTGRLEKDLKKEALLQELGYKKLDILKRLKILGALEPGRNRPYDYAIRINGDLKRYYRILLAEESNIEEKADEEFNNVFSEVLPMVRRQNQACN